MAAIQSHTCEHTQYYYNIKPPMRRLRTRNVLSDVGAITISSSRVRLLLDSKLTIDVANITISSSHTRLLLLETESPYCMAYYNIKQPCKAATICCTYGFFGYLITISSSRKRLRTSICRPHKLQYQAAKRLLYNPVLENIHSLITISSHLERRLYSPVFL